MASSSISQQRCVFVGNIPYDATEEQLIQICEEVGPVVSFRLVTDRETGKPKGYGFCEYKDEETAFSARRNLLGYEINGRQLRVDFAENDKGSDKNREQGRGGPGMTSNGDPQKPVGAPAILMDSAHLQPIGLSLATAAASIMAGALGGAQSSSNTNSNAMYSQAGLEVDPLTLHLAKMSRAQLNDIFSELKGMSLQDNDLARQLLVANPLLSKALFQAQIMLGMVTPEMMANIQHGGSLLHHVSENSQHGRPPLAQNKMQYGLMPNVQAGQALAVPPHIMSQVLKPNLAPVQFQQPQFPAQSGISTLPSNGPKPLTGFSASPQITVSSSSNLNQQTQLPSLQHPGSYETANLGQDRQPMNPKESFPHLILPQVSDHSFKVQPFSSTMSNVLESMRNDSDRLGQATIDANSLPRTGNYSNLMPGPSKWSSMVHDNSEPLDRPSKLVKLNGRTDSGPRPSQVLGTGSSVNHILKPQNQQPGQQVSQVQLPPDMESALLQQVINLTPEQLSMLPPDQKQQVLHLQQMLR